jgi:hypothetical protein
MANSLIRYAKGQGAPTIRFIGLTEASGQGVNVWRYIAADTAIAINMAAKQYGLRKIHKGKVLGYDDCTDGKDEYGSYKIWDFPVFVTNKDELVIYAKVWTNDVHGGSCVMWCNPYSFKDIPSAAQFETQCNTATAHAEQMVKRYVRKNQK